MRFKWGMDCGVDYETRMIKREKIKPLRWLVMWSRLEQVVAQSLHLQVRQRLLVLFRPM